MKSARVLCALGLLVPLILEANAQSPPRGDASAADTGQAPGAAAPSTRTESARGGASRGGNAPLPAAPRSGPPPTQSRAAAPVRSNADRLHALLHPHTAGAKASSGTPGGSDRAVGSSVAARARGQREPSQAASQAQASQWVAPRLSSSNSARGSSPSPKAPASLHAQSLNALSPNGVTPNALGLNALSLKTASGGGASPSSLKAAPARDSSIGGPRIAALGRVGGPATGRAATTARAALDGALIRRRGF